MLLSQNGGHLTLRSVWQCLNRKPNCDDVAGVLALVASFAVPQKTETNRCSGNVMQSLGDRSSPTQPCIRGVRLESSFDFLERDDCMIKASAIQAVVRLAQRRDVFCQWQKALEHALIHSYFPVKSQGSQRASMAPLEKLLRLSAVDGYFQLLLVHQKAPTSNEAKSIILRALGSPFAPTSPDSGLLPIGPRFIHLNASWKSALTLLSYAIDVNHEISRNDLEHVSRLCSEQAPPRVAGKLLGLLRRHSVDADEASPPAQRVFCSDLLFCGKWRDVLSRFQGCQQEQLALRDAGSETGVALASRDLWAFQKSFFHCTREKKQKLRSELREALSSLSFDEKLSSKSAELQHQIVSSFHFREVIPQTVPKSLVRFEAGGTSRALSYLLRSPFLELLPFLLLAAASSENEDVLRATRKVVFEPLLKRTSWVTSYCSLGDMIMFGHGVHFLSLLVPLSTHRRIVRELLRPWWVSEDVIRLFSTPALVDSDESSRRMIFAQSVEDHCPLSRLSDIDATLRSWDNFWCSAWIEAMCCVGPLGHSLSIAGVLLSQCCEGSSPHPRCVVSPECAAAVATSIATMVLHSAPLGADFPTSVFFVIPMADGKVSGPQKYFRWLYDESFIAPVKSVDGIREYRTDSWTSPLGMLGGRAFRLASHLPSVPRSHATNCCVQLWRLDVPSLVAFSIKHFCESAPSSHGIAVAARFSSNSSKSDGNGLWASVMYKPSGVSTTLHTRAPSVSAFLAARSFWKRTTDHSQLGPATGGEKVQRCEGADNVSVLAQEGLVNRIDLGTSGLVVAAHSSDALWSLRRTQLVDKASRKVYYALVVHVPPSDRAISSESLWASQSCPLFLLPRGTIGGDVATEGSSFSTRQRYQYAPSYETRPDSKEASTQYTVVESFFPVKGQRSCGFIRSAHYLVRVELVSGKRHQIRQHFSSIHHPLLGDVQYHPRSASPWISRVALHAGEVTVWGDSRPIAQAEVGDAVDEILARRRRTTVLSSLPQDMVEVIRLLRNASA